MSHRSRDFEAMMYALEDIADARRRSAEWVPTRFLEGLPDPVDSQLAEQPFPVQQQQEQLDNLLPAQVVDHVGFWDEPSKRAALGLKITLDHMLLVDELLEVVNKKDRPRAAIWDEFCACAAKSPKAFSGRTSGHCLERFWKSNAPVEPADP